MKFGNNFIILFVQHIISAQSYSSISCYQCNSSTDQSCKTLKGGQISKICDKPLWGELEGCFTSIQIDGTVQRGCGYKRNNFGKYPCALQFDDSLYCKCKMSGCNLNGLSPGFKCYQCSSLKDSSCFETLEGLEPTDCFVPGINGCLKKIKEDGNVIRTCAVVVMEEEEKDCGNNFRGKGKCHYCKGNGCNGKKLGGRGAKEVRGDENRSSSSKVEFYKEWTLLVIFNAYSYFII